MVHNCRVRPNILKTALGGCLVGYFCVKHDFCEDIAGHTEFETSHSPKSYLLKMLNLRANEMR